MYIFVVGMAWLLFYLGTAFPVQFSQILEVSFEKWSLDFTHTDMADNNYGSEKKKKKNLQHQNGTNHIVV